MKNIFRTSVIGMAASLFISCLGFNENVPGLSDVPSVSLDSVSASSAKVNISVSATIHSAKGASDIREQGFYLDLDQNFANPQKVTASIEGNTFTFSMKPEYFDTTYYCKAFIHNGYSEILSSVSSVRSHPFSHFVTLTTPQVIATENIGEVLVSSSVSAAEGITLTDIGICYSKSPNPTVDSQKKSAGTSKGDIKITIGGLTLGETYYFRAYSQSESEIAYSQIISFMPHVLPTVITSPVSEITMTSATCGGKITSSGFSPVISRGVVWNTEHYPTVELSTKTIDSCGIGEYVSHITGLTKGVTYYVRAYATNAKGTAYGEECSFISGACPIVSTSDVSAITSSSSICGGNVTSDGGFVVTSRGIVWSTSPNPTVEQSSKTSEGSGTGPFSSTLTGLKYYTKYYVRAYAINEKGTAYGEEKSFTTDAVMPFITTAPVSLITTSSATCGGDVTSDGGASVTSRGVVWDTHPNPSISLVTKTSDGTGIGSFVSSITSLSKGGTYYVRAYATNSKGTAYGEEISFTADVTSPTVTTSSISNVSSSTASCGGNVTTDGGLTVTARGVVWSTNPNPTIDLSTKTNDGYGTGAYSSLLSNLSPGTKYYVRAYATNSKGTSYGDEKSFTTEAVLPTVTTAEITSITSSSAVCGGNVTYDGGATVIAKGVVWSTSHNPTISLSTKTNDGSGTGAYSSSISNLSPGAQYYVRAYATNSKGTSYGEEKTLTVKPKGSGEDIGNDDYEW